MFTTDMAVGILKPTVAGSGQQSGQPEKLVSDDLDSSLANLVGSECEAPSRHFQLRTKKKQSKWRNLTRRLRFLPQTWGSGTARWKSKWQAGRVDDAAAARCSQASDKLLLTHCLLIHSDIHWSQPGEKRMTGGTNWQPKAAPTTTWNPVSMVTLVPSGSEPLTLHLSLCVFLFSFFFALTPLCPACVSSATVSHGLPRHHTDGHDGIWHGQWNAARRVAQCRYSDVFQTWHKAKRVFGVGEEKGGSFCKSDAISRKPCL